MKNNKYDSRVSENAYIKSLQGLKLGNAFLAKLNAEFIMLISTLLQYFLNSESWHSPSDFLVDFGVFATQMKKKYSTKERYDYTPISHYDRLRLLKPNKINSDKDKSRLEKRHGSDEFTL